MLSGILAGIIIIVLILSALFGGGYKSAVKNYFEGFEDADAEKFMKSMPKCQVEYLEKSMKDYDKYDSFKEYFQYIIEEALDEAEDKYGDDISISYEINNKKDLSDKELKDIRKRLRNNYQDNDVDVTKGYEVAITEKIKGDDDSEKKDLTLKAAKVDGDWCIVSGGVLPI